MVRHKNDQELLKQILRRAFSFKENINTFANFVFRDYASAPMAEFHNEVYDFLFEPTDGALGAPRGHAKSTIAGLFFLSYTIVNRLDPYVIYVSSNYSKTVQFLEPIRTEFRHNKRLNWLYGNMSMSYLKDEEGKDREDCFDVNNVRVEAVSFEQNLRGFKYKSSRPTLILLDDIEDDQRVLNPDLRYKDGNKLNKIIIPSLDPVRGRVKMFGTILHWDSQLIKKIRAYNGKIFKACTVDFKNVLWPEYWTEQRLRDKKASIGSVAFSSEFLNNPIENEASLIKGEWIDKCFDRNLSYEEAVNGVYDTTFLGCDFAFGDRVTNDNSAYVGLGQKDKKNVLTSIDIYHGLTITEQFEIISNMYKTGKYGEVVLEENSIKSLSRELYTYEFKYYLIWTGATDPAAKLKSDKAFDNKRHSVGKKAMILRLASLFENNNIVIPYKTDNDKEKSNRLKDELMTFALDSGKLVEVGIHADVPIGLAMACERAGDTGGFIMDLGEDE